MKKVLLILVVLIFGLASCGTDASVKKGQDQKENSMDKVSFVLDWTPNTNHTGIYVAKKKGYFQDAGLDVDIILPGEVGADQLVASGKADFGISAQESVTQARVEGVPIVSIAAVIQHNTSGFASPKAKNITSPKDFVGKTYGGWGAPVEKAVIESLMKQENASSDEVDIVNMGDTDFFTAVKRDIDFAWIYYGWTGIEAEQRGQKLNMLYLTDYSKDLDYYTPVITTNEKMMKKQPDVIKRLMKAVSRGYEFAIDHPDKAADMLLDAVPDLDHDLVYKSQEWLSPKYQDDAKQWGTQKLSIWQGYAGWMYDNGLLDKKLDSKQAFTNKFLPKNEGE